MVDISYFLKCQSLRAIVLCWRELSHHILCYQQNFFIKILLTTWSKEMCIRCKNWLMDGTIWPKRAALLNGAGNKIRINRLLRFSWCCHHLLSEEIWNINATFLGVGQHLEKFLWYWFTLGRKGKNLPTTFYKFKFFKRKIIVCSLLVFSKKCRRLGVCFGGFSLAVCI